jgi:hypothetical protein
MSKSSSLFALYRRGRRYRDPATSSDNPEAEKSREERERFIAAALALCLRCDAGFRERFWRNVCRVSDDPDSAPPIRAEGILLEPPHWADLRLITDNYIWVVEIKTGASLKEKQNPSLPEFEREGIGYGWFLNRHEAALRRMRYIVLGAAESFELPPQHAQFPIWLRRASWDDVYRCRATVTKGEGTNHSLVDDLFACLAAFDLSPFTMDNAKSIHVTTGLVGVGDALAVLQAVCQLLGAKYREKQLSIFTLDSVSFFGIYIVREGVSEPFVAKLQSVCDGHTYVTWVGYLADAKDSITRSCWVYFASSEKRDSMLPRMRLRFDSAEPHLDDGVHPAIEIRSSPADGANDLDWFRSVLEFAATLAS